MVTTAMEFDSRADLRSHHAENQDRRQSQSLQSRRDQHARPYQPPTQSAYQPSRLSNAPSHMMQVDAISPTNPTQWYLAPRLSSSEQLMPVLRRIRSLPRNLP
jgi:hypothetical protein